MRRRGTTNETLVRLAGLGDRLTHDSPARAPGFRSLHTHARTRCTASCYVRTCLTEAQAAWATTDWLPCLAAHRAVTAVSALTVSPSLLQFIADPILAVLAVLTVPWPLLGGPCWAHSPRIGMLCCSSCWGPRASRVPRFAPPVCPQSAPVQESGPNSLVGPATDK